MDAAEPWSSGSEPDEDDGDHIESRRQYWRDFRAKAAPGKRGRKDTADTACACVHCGQPLAGAKPEVKEAPRRPSRAAAASPARTKAAVKNVECKECCGRLSAVYCSEKCRKNDALRHRDECNTFLYDEEIADVVMAFRYGRPISDSADTYRVGEHADRQITIKRWLPSPGSAHPAPPIVPPVEDPVAEWKRQHDPKSVVCSRPWVSLGTPTAVTVTWMAPICAGRYPTVNYDLEIRCRPAADADPSDWTTCSEPHTGTVPSHIVNGLTCGEWVEFRVRMLVPESGGDLPGSPLLETLPRADDAGFSETSLPFRVGYADHTAVIPPPHKRGDGPVVPPSDFSEDEIRYFQTLKTPGAIQDYLDSIPMNHEIQDDTCLSALESVRQNHAHCIEGAMLGAYILSLQGYPPYLMDLRACAADDDHIVTPFRIGRRWGCLSVSNHASLRFRNPVYRTLREMIMSFFDDYMNGKGERTLRAYSQPIHLAAVFGPQWHARRGDAYEIAEFVDAVKHYRLVDDSMLKHLRPADEMVLATTVHQREWPAPDNFDEEQVRRNENK